MSKSALLVFGSIALTGAIFASAQTQASDAAALIGGIVGLGMIVWGLKKNG